MFQHVLNVWELHQAFELRRIIFGIRFSGQNIGRPIYYDETLGYVYEEHWIFHSWDSCLQSSQCKKESIVNVRSSFIYILKYYSALSVTLPREILVWGYFLFISGYMWRNPQIWSRKWCQKECRRSSPIPSGKTWCFREPRRKLDYWRASWNTRWFEIWTIEF